MLESIACCHPIRPKLSVKVYNVFCKEHEEGQFTIKVSYEEAIQPNRLVELVGDFWKTHSPLGGAGTIKHSRRCVFGCAMPFFNWWKSVVELFQYSCASQGLLTDSEQCYLEPVPELVFDS